jgi:hypothetical protein
MLVSQEGTNTFGAVFVFEGDSVVQITVGRSQWSLDVAVAPAAVPGNTTRCSRRITTRDMGDGSRAVGTRPAGAPFRSSFRTASAGVRRYQEYCAGSGRVTSPTPIAEAPQQRSALILHRNR